MTFPESAPASRQPQKQSIARLTPFVVAAKSHPVCMLPGTELAFAHDVKYDRRWIWTRALAWRVGQFNRIEPDVPDRHHDAIEFPDGSRVLVTQLCEGQRVTVLQLPVLQPAVERAPATTATATTTSFFIG